MKSTLLRYCTAVAALAVLSACIPIRNEVSLSRTGFQGSRVPLAPDEGIVIFGVRSDDGMAACVRSAITGAATPTRVVPLNEFQSATGGVFASPTASATEQAVSDALYNATASPAYTALKMRYVFMVEGETVTTGVFRRPTSNLFTTR